MQRSLQRVLRMAMCQQNVTIAPVVSSCRQLATRSTEEEPSSQKQHSPFKRSPSTPPFGDKKTGDSLKGELVNTFLGLERLDKNLFRAHHLLRGRRDLTHVYGGQVIGQAMMAAAATVDDTFHPHSLHSYFIKPGNSDFPILYQVDPVRTGRSFCTRSVRAIQDGETIYMSEISYQVQEEAGIEHQSSMPDVPPPEKLRNGMELVDEALSKVDDNTNPLHVRFWTWRKEEYPAHFDTKPVDPEDYLLTGQPHFRQLRWIKANSQIGDDPRLHQCVAAFISDSLMLPAATFPHFFMGFFPSMLFSLDHSIWMHHHKFRIDEWMLHEADSPIASGGRTFTNGKLWSQDGTLVISTAQEGLVRGTKFTL